MAALNMDAIRTAITESVEASASTTFSSGAFAGQPDEALMARLRQTSTASHWFDVVVSPGSRSEYSNVVTKTSSRLAAFDVRIPVWTGLATEAQESSRSTTLAAIGADCDTACRALARPGAIDQTAAAVATGVCGGLMTGPDGRGYPAWRLLAEDWQRRQLRHEIRGQITVDVSPEQAPNLITSLGADLLYYWEVPESGSQYITLNGSNASQLNDRVGSAHMVQATASSQPTYYASGGPNDRPYLQLQDEGRFLRATVSISAGNRVGMYVVSQAPASGTGRVPSQLAHGGATKLAIGYRDAAAVRFDAYAELTDGTQDLTVTSPAHDESWHLHAFRPLSTGTLYQIDGTTVTTNFTGSSTMTASNQCDIGYGSSNIAGGKVSFIALVNDPTSSKDTVVKNYCRVIYGLSL